jgi:hypothetical protein
MEFDDFLENRGRKHGNYHEQRPHDDDRYSNGSYYSHQGQDDHLKWQNILDKIKGNKKLKQLVILAGVSIFIIVVVLIIILLPIIMKLIGYIGQNGLQGILENITGLLDTIWKGSSK